jgi:putative serine protease PepD
MEPAIVTIMAGEKPLGAAALIDRSGWFVAHRKAVTAREVTGRMSDGQTIQLTVKGEDSLTQLVLLEAASWEPSRARPFFAPMSNDQAGGNLIAVLPTGPIRAECVSARFGVVKPSRRLVPLNEMRFEAPAEEVGTALVFSEQGALLGALSATLGAPESQTRIPGNTLTNPRILGQSQIYGPSQMTVAYTAGAQVMKRVMQGFLSPLHEVQYPTLGVMCVDTPGGGATIQQIVKDSPAAKSGFRVGDVIVDIGGTLIRNQVDFARVMLEQDIDQKVTIRVKRGMQNLLLEPTIAKDD